MGRDDAAPAPGLGLAGPAATGLERRQELAVEVVVAAGRRRAVIRVGTVDERVVFMRPRGAAERGHAARRKAPLALRRRKAGGEASHSAISVFYRRGLCGYAGAFFTIPSAPTARPVWDGATLAFLSGKTYALGVFRRPLFGTLKDIISGFAAFS